MLAGIRAAKTELEKLKIQADNAEITADLGTVAEIRYGKIPHIQKDLETKLKRLKTLQKSRRVLNEEVAEQDIAAVVSRWTGIPVAKMLEEEAVKLSRMEETLKKGIIGQDSAVKKVTDAVKRSRVGISDPNRPIGSFLFLGPTGVGKTELSKNRRVYVQRCRCARARGYERIYGETFSCQAHRRAPAMSATRRRAR